MHPLVGDPFIAQIRHARGLRAEEQVADRVSQHPVDLLGHLAIEAPKAGFYVHEPHTELHRHEPARDGTVHVADHENRVRLLLEYYWLERGHDLRRLHRVRGAPDAEVEVRLRDSELVKEEVAHIRVVVLAGVNEQRLGAIETSIGLDQRRDLHQVGPRAHNVQDLHGGDPTRSSSSR